MALPRNAPVVPGRSSPLKTLVTEKINVPYDDSTLPISDETKPSKLDLGDEDDWSMYEDIFALDGEGGFREGSDSGRLHTNYIARATLTLMTRRFHFPPRSLHLPKTSTRDWSRCVHRGNG